MIWSGVVTVIAQSPYKASHKHLSSIPVLSASMAWLIVQLAMSAASYVLSLQDSGLEIREPCCAGSRKQGGLWLQRASKAERTARENEQGRNEG